MSKTPEAPSLPFSAWLVLWVILATQAVTLWTVAALDAELADHASDTRARFHGLRDQAEATHALTRRIDGRTP